MIRDASKCLMLKWIHGIEKLDALNPSQLEKFVSNWNQFEYMQYSVHKRTIASLTIDSVKKFDFDGRVYDQVLVGCYYTIETSDSSLFIEIIVNYYEY